MTIKEIISKIFCVFGILFGLKVGWDIGLNGFHQVIANCITVLPVLIGLAQIIIVPVLVLLIVAIFFEIAFQILY
jgi:hypothetical protein